MTRKQLIKGLANRDHIVPASLGGTNHRSNLRLAHYWCNIRRGNDLPNNGQPSHDEKMLTAFENQEGLCPLCDEALALDRKAEGFIRQKDLAHRVCIRRDRGM
ncbi:hypothetical protein SEA_PARADIDDLES_122 [Streptomyces phage Paradiddles]|uniref:HNH domain-containing protein n=1 Tax=Streptomyces phage Paradiddles TaxID=2023993 RepID=A0A222YZ92_9CAUD|nr:HNH endonuclease [Streptomyces phage Paradiddles]ASR77592.1 hypothetical protein SEA_PARADIDDLES_122 [Streptomyces phage Paradiddles]